MTQNPTRSQTPAGTPPPSRLREHTRELGAALLFLTGSDRERLDHERVARGGAFFPALGLLLGALVAVALLALEPMLPPPALGACGVALLALSSRGVFAAALGRVARVAFARGDDPTASLEAGGLGAVGGLTLLVVLAAKGAALATLGGSTLGLAVVLAVVLGRWAIVVQAYGSLAARPDGLAAVFVREMKFGQFGVASVSAMAAVLVLSNAIGVLLLVGAATVTVGLRILVHRWLGGVAPATLDAAAELAETVVILLCAALVLLARALEG
jgi:cobalamin synthase